MSGVPGVRTGLCSPRPGVSNVNANHVSAGTESRPSEKRDPTCWTLSAVAEHTGFVYKVSVYANIH